MAYEQHAGVGGSSTKSDIPVGEELDFSDVINESVPLSEEILYAYPIDGKTTTELINQLQGFFSADAVATSTNVLINNIDTSLAKTNSNQFYLGSEAKKNIGNMQAIGETINSLSSYSSQLDVAEITTLIASYNQHLQNLKKNARRELLETAAEKFNSENHEWGDYPKTRTYKLKNGGSTGGAYSPYNDSAVEYLKGNDNAVFEVELVSTDGYSKKVYGPDGEYLYDDYYESTTYKIHKYKRIKCTNLLGFLQSPWDPTFEEIEAQFEFVGCKLPYNKNNPQVQSDASKNNAWGWNGKY